MTQPCEDYQPAVFNSLSGYRLVDHECILDEGHEGQHVYRVIEAAQ